MTLEEFIKTTHEEVEKFKLFYLANRKQAMKGASKNGAENWPLEQEEGDWFEQFLSWQGTDKED